MVLKRLLTHLLGERLRRYVLPVVVLSTAGLIIAIVVNRFTPHVYRVEAVLSPVADGGIQEGGMSRLLGGLGGLAGMVGLPLSSDAQKNEALAILRSRTFTYEFIRSHNLLPVLFASKWDSDKAAWKADVRVPTLSDGYRVLDKSIRKVAENKSTGLVTLSIDWRDRVQATEWADSMIMQLNEEMRRRAIEDAGKSLRYLKEQLSSTSVVGLQEAIYRLVEAQMNRQMLAQVRAEYAFRVLDAPTTPDERDWIWPRLRVLAILGVAIGGILGLGWGLITERSVSS